MGDELIDFLIQLGRDPDKLRRFDADPAAAMEAARLSPAQRAALASRDPRRINRLLTEGRLLGQHTYAMAVYVCDVSDKPDQVKPPPKPPAPPPKSPPKAPSKPPKKRTPRPRPK